MAGRMVAACWREWHWCGTAGSNKLSNGWQLQSLDKRDER
jgi:hypothetical protein